MKNLFTLLLCLVTFVTATAQESVLLRVKYNKGDKYAMNMTMDQDMSVMKMNMGMYMQIDVKDVVDNIYDTEITFNRIVMDMDQGGMKINYDSNKTDEELDDAGKMMKSQMGPVLDMIIGAKFNDRGETTEMTMIKGPAGGEQQFKQTSSVTYPENAVKVGDTWSDTKEENGMTFTYAYKVEEIKPEMVVLSVSGTIAGTAEGTLTGALNVSRASGLPENSVIDMKMNVMGQDAVMKVTVTTEKL